METKIEWQREQERKRQEQRYFTKRKKNWVRRVMFIARAVTIAPWVADFVKEEGAVTADETDAQELFMP